MALNEYAIIDLGEVKRQTRRLWHSGRGSERSYFYEILVSADGVNYLPVYKGQSEIKSSDKVQHCRICTC